MGRHGSVGAGVDLAAGRITPSATGGELVSANTPVCKFYDVGTRISECLLLPNREAGNAAFILVPTHVVIGNVLEDESGPRLLYYAR